MINKNITSDSIIMRWTLFFLLTMSIIIYPFFGVYPEAAADSGSVDTTIDELVDRFAKTKAVGAFTKLSFKGNFTRLNKSFGVYHGGKRPPTIEELKERYDLIVQEMIVLVQNKDPDLARDFYAARLLLWSYLADPDKYVSL